MAAFADFVTVDRSDLSIAGHSGEDLLPILVFSLNRSAVRDVVVNGRFVVRDGRHELQDEIISRYGRGSPEGLVDSLNLPGMPPSPSQVFWA